MVSSTVALESVQQTRDALNSLVEMDGGLVAYDGSSFLVCCVRHSSWEEEDLLALECDAVWRGESILGVSHEGYEGLLHYQIQDRCLSLPRDSYIVFFHRHAYQNVGRMTLFADIYRKRVPMTRLVCIPCLHIETTNPPPS